MGTIDANRFLVGGQITPEGREAGLTEDDIAGGQLTPEAQARLGHATEEEEPKPKATSTKTTKTTKAKK